MAVDSPRLKKGRAARCGDDVAVIHVDLSADPAREKRASSWLDGRELERSARFLFPGPRRRFLLCRAALRKSLCEHLGCSNEELAFGASYYGKPYAILRGTPHSINFNVSHSGDYGLVAYGTRGRIGVDIEEWIDHRNLDQLIAVGFTPIEQSELMAVTGRERQHLFFHLWTLKESLIKAQGKGMSIDISRFEVPIEMRLGATDSLFSFPQAISEFWRLESICGDGYCAAIALEQIPGSQPFRAGQNRNIPVA